MVRQGIALALMSIACATAMAAAQRRAGSVRCSDDPGAVGALMGHLVTDGSPVSLRRGVSLSSESPGRSCVVSADSTGSFELQGLQPGKYTLTMGSLGIEPIAAIPVTISADQPTTVTIRLRAADGLSECMGDSRCAAMLVRPTPVELSGPDDRALDALAFRLALALSHEAWALSARPVVCVPQPMVNVLRAVYEEVVAEGECARPVSPTDPQGLRSRLKHTPTGRDAIQLRVTRIQRNGAMTATLNLYYSVASLWAAGFECKVRKRAGQWIPQSCALTVVS
jgi:hypothetical protein